MAETPTVVGVVSDTHGLLRPEVLETFYGADLLLHAGDIGDASVLRGLERVAPVHAVRGNCDVSSWARRLPERTTVDVGRVRIHLLHAVEDLLLDPTADDISVVVTGHSHEPSVEERDGVLFVNPGSAGPRRFRLPVAVARLTVRGGRVDAEIVRLEVPELRLPQD